MSDDEPNRDQAREWNERGGPRWVAMERDLDAQLAPFGATVIDALEPAPGERVLDVGCGAGAMSLAIAERVRPGEVVGVDISGPMIARARERAQAVENLRFEEADAQTFAFASGAPFDAIASRFGVMFFADPIEAFTNLRAALRPGGRLAFVCWRALRENPAFTLPLEAALSLVPEPPRSPERGAPGPFAFADGDRVRSILEQAGYADIEVVAHDSDVIVAGRPELDGAVDLAMQIGPLSRALPRTMTEALRAQIRARVRDALAPHHRPTGVTLPAATWIVTARRAA